ncbi:hypothetical protein [Candidatus Laterigemmans baculatus]|uniref:hypothetical protein n=1 Tax=Candidatus Laterigemmans baculatus TaxID=2770505 RepID=UPI0013DD3FF1|nr:hypothetical protein [Candidatus Laterigemmans baculatus]
MSESESRSPGGFGKANRYDRAAPVPRSHTSAAAPDGKTVESGLPGGTREAVRDVSLEALLFRLDEALAAIRSLDEVAGEEPGASGIAAEDPLDECDGDG